MQKDYIDFSKEKPTEFQSWSELDEDNRYGAILLNEPSYQTEVTHFNNYEELMEWCTEFDEEWDDGHNWKMSDILDSWDLFPVVLSARLMADDPDFPSTRVTIYEED
jgi:hypothetical protein